MAQLPMVSMPGLGSVSCYALGGGGVGQVWGAVDREECVATVRRAMELGVTFIDMAPGYKIAESVVGETFSGNPPDHMKFTTKYGLGDEPIATVEAKCRESLMGSLAAMRLKKVDVFFLHSHLVPDEFPLDTPGKKRQFTPWSTYVNGFIPAAEKLKAEGLIGAWGITGTSWPDQVIQALNSTPKPQFVQVVSNFLDSAGGMSSWQTGPSRCREIGQTAKNNGVNIMCIRAVQAGALTDKIDRDIPPRPGTTGDRDRTDFDYAAPVREIAKSVGMSMATLAHRYTLGMHGGGTVVVLGVKNRPELEECVAAAKAGPLDPELVKRVDAAVADVIPITSGATPPKPKM